jgi:hypothetical protein
MRRGNLLVQRISKNSRAENHPGDSSVARTAGPLHLPNRPCLSCFFASGKILNVDPPTIKELRGIAKGMRWKE